jgi:hypothetical protein
VGEAEDIPLFFTLIPILALLSNYDQENCLINVGTEGEAKFLEVRFSVSRMLVGGPLYLGGHSDFGEAVELSNRIHGLPPEATERFIEDHLVYMAGRVLAGYLKPHWRVVQRLATELVEKRRLAGEDVARICDAAPVAGEDKAA